MSEYRYANVEELSKALRAREVSARELAKEALTLLDSVGRPYNAVATLLGERSRREADFADGELAEGRGGPLCGIPYGAKDLFAAQGGPTTWGAQEFADQFIDEDADVIRRLGESGSVLVAKLTMSELAGGGRPSQPGASLHGSGRNPWDVSRYSGGSSSGSGIAVATGLVPFALGTETGGSVLGPAAFSGVTGFRPTPGTISRDGSMTLSRTLDKIGVLARSARDCAAVVSALRDSPPSGAQPQVRKELDTLRVAISTDELTEASPSIRKTLAQGFREFKQICPHILEDGLDRDPAYVRAVEDVVRIEGAFEFRDKLRQDDFHMTDDRQLTTLRSGLEARAVDYIEALQVADRAKDAFRRVFDDADLVVSASRTTVAPPLSREREPRDPTKMSDLLRAAGNLAGVPGVSFPCGLSDEGLPVGLQVVGPPHSDDLLLGVAAAYQDYTDHHMRRPPDFSTWELPPSAGSTG